MAGAAPEAIRDNVLNSCRGAGRFTSHSIREAFPRKCQRLWRRDPINNVN